MNDQMKKMLNQNNYKNINLYNFALNYPMIDLEIFDGSIMLRGVSDHQWCYISLSDEHALKDAVRRIKKDDRYFVIQDELMLQYLKSHYKIEWTLECKKFIYTDTTLGNPKYDVEQLTEEDAQYIQQKNSYGDFTSVDYIKERIRNGIGLGIRNDGKLVAWILTHDDGALGFMHVLSEYRGMGYAKALTIESIKRIQAQGLIPFVHIEASNERSIQLATKSGFTFFGHIYWVKVE